MLLRDIGEFGLIERLSKIVQAQDEDIIANIGDDCACVKISGENVFLTVDTQIENVHFIKDRIDPVDLGWKLSSSNVSDIVCCGGKPKYALISLSLPKTLELDFVEGLYQGVKQAQDYYGFKTVGGNVTSSYQIMLDMTLIGHGNRFISRSQAKAGQYLYLTGFTGLSRAGLELVLSGKSEFLEYEDYLIGKHYRPIARIDKLETIIKFAKSSIDISDGLVADLYHISKQSKVKVIVEKDKVPVHSSLKQFCNQNNKDCYEYALYGGEDYQIVFSSDDMIEEEDISMIGYIDEGQGVYLKDKDKFLLLEEKGYTHLV